MMLQHGLYLKFLKPKPSNPKNPMQFFKSNSVRASKLAVLFLLLSFSPSILSAQTWQIDGSHTNVMFSIDHMMISETTGRFKIIEGTITSSKADFSDAMIDVKIPISSIDTDNADRDKHLQADDFFDSAKYPYMTFKSTSIKKGSGNDVTVTGNLTIKGKTKPVTLKGKMMPATKDPWGNMRAGFGKLTTTIDRQDFGVAGGGAMVGDEVRLTINAEVIQPAGK